MITLRRSWLKKCGLLAAGCLVTLALTALGRLASPLTAEGRPLLYTPAVRAAELYRSETAGWAGATDRLLERVGSLLAAPAQDPYRLAETMDGILSDAGQLAELASARRAPPALAGLQNLCESAAGLTLAAATAAARWSAVPTADNMAAAQTALQGARQELERITASPWLEQPDPVQPAAAASEEPAAGGIWGQ